MNDKSEPLYPPIYAPPAPQGWQPRGRVVQLGVIEFHSQRVNPGLMEDFYMVTKDCTAAGVIVDIWLMDIATILARHGYTMTITTEKPLPVPVYALPPPPTGTTR